MAKVAAEGKGASDDPWVLKTPPGTSEYKMYRDEASDPPALVPVVGTTKLSYQLRCVEDLHAMLKEHDGWMLLASYPPPQQLAEAARLAGPIGWRLLSSCTIIRL